MPIARRPLLTATAAGSLLCALWFVPSANATDAPGKPQSAPAHSSAAASGPESDLALADTGSVDTSPYLFGGTLFLGVGAGFVAFSVRRARRQY
ncbi:hypothetical protein AB0G73_32585 [Streptomyces sp. NPDC020719]|uniref:hypothetical protein n=1 Tax=unclassified Streptomyces TaxID=2593676 RepID=UPI0033C5F184